MRKAVIPAGIAGIRMPGMAIINKHVHVFWMSAIPADMTIFLKLARMG